MACKHDEATYPASLSYSSVVSDTCQPRLCPVVFRIRAVRSMAVRTESSSDGRPLITSSKVRPPISSFLGDNISGTLNSSSSFSRVQRCAALVLALSKLSKRTQPLNRCMKNGSDVPFSGLSLINSVLWSHSSRKDMSVVTSVLRCSLPVASAGRKKELSISGKVRRGGRVRGGAVDGGSRGRRS